MSEHTIKAASRNAEGKGASRRLRHAAQLPAIVYGANAAPQHRYALHLRKASFLRTHVAAGSAKRVRRFLARAAGRQSRA